MELNALFDFPNRLVLRVRTVVGKLLEVTCNFFSTCDNVFFLCFLIIIRLSRKYNLQYTKITVSM